MIYKKQKTIIILLLLFLTLPVSRSLIFSQDRPPYASTQPINTPKLFLIGTSQHPFDLTFTEDGKTAYLMGDSGLVMCNYVNGRWSKPVIPEFARNFAGIETPEITHDGKKFFFLGIGNRNQPNGFYVMNKTETGWSDPLNIGINIEGFKTDATTSVNGNLYFLSTINNIGSLYFSKFTDGKYSEPQKLNSVINNYNVFTPYISPDDSYILFSILRRSGNNNFANLFISFRKNDTEWTEPKDLGPKINAGYFQQRPYISPDGKYLFFTRSTAYSTGIYQVDWEAILDSLRDAALPISMESNSINTLPDKFSLSQNYPNPFNPETMISYQLPVTGHVALKVFDMLGSEVTTLVNEQQTAGNYQVKFDSGNLSSGVYLYSIKAGYFTKSNKMILMK